jgi:lysophospholipase L1-like esterase
MRKEWTLLVGVVVLTLIVSLGLIRWLAPQLLGIPIDLQMVRVSKETPPFFEVVFRRSDLETSDLLLKDPYTNVRARPLLLSLAEHGGPHDILGFRNYRVPNVADVVAIGDSQTYGNNAAIEENWPNQIRRLLGHRHPEVYCMATGGWSAVQYLNMFRHATALRPRVIVVAYYTGNDPDEAVSVAYSTDDWVELRPAKEIDIRDKPRFPGSPPPLSEQWSVRFRNGNEMTFAPSLRLVSNDSSYATVRAGYKIIEKTAQLMDTSVAKAKIGLVLTIIPTKELVYAERLRREGIQQSEDYAKLVAMEQNNIARLVSAFQSLKHAQYVDVVHPLQQAAMANEPIYPAEVNGHPIAGGYRVIAKALLAAIDRYLVTPPLGLVGIPVKGRERTYRPFLVNKEGLWTFASEELITANGWRLIDAHHVEPRDLASLPQMGTIHSVDRKRFGPDLLHRRVHVGTSD